MPNCCSCPFFCPPTLATATFLWPSPRLPGLLVCREVWKLHGKAHGEGHTRRDKCYFQAYSQGLQIITKQSSVFMWLSVISTRIDQCLLQASAWKILSRIMLIHRGSVGRNRSSGDTAVMSRFKEGIMCLSKAFGGRREEVLRDNSALIQELHVRQDGGAALPAPAEHPQPLGNANDMDETRTTHRNKGEPGKGQLKWDGCKSLRGFGGEPGLSCSISAAACGVVCCQIGSWDT